MSKLEKLFGLECIDLGTWKEFDDLDKRNQQNFPVRFKLVRLIEDTTNFIERSYRNFKWFVIHRVHPKHRYHVVDTKLKPGYYDPDILILNACFSLLVDFYEGTKNTISWEHSEEHQRVKQEMDELYYWWTEERPKREDLMPELPSFPEDWGSSPMFNPEYDGTSEMEAWNKACDKRWEAEVFYEDEDKYMLKKLIDIKSFLWYP